MHRAKLALLAGTSLCLAMGSAHAAPPPPPFDPWTGWYVGANFGYSWGKVDSTTTVGPYEQGPPLFSFFFPGGTSSISSKPVGPIRGVQAGFIAWFAPGWLAGFE